MKFLSLVLVIVLQALAIPVARAGSDVAIHAVADAFFFDRASELRVSGLPPGSEAVLTVTATDGAGQSWWSQNVYRAGPDGIVDPATDAPVRGTYEGVQASGPFWSMVGGDRFHTSQDADVQIRLSDATGHVLAERGVRWLSPRAASGISTEALPVSGLAATLYLPDDGTRPLPVVVVLGGSGGGSNGERAALLASRGYAALDIAYFGAEGTPAYFVETLPLERFFPAFDRLESHPRVDASRIAVMGRSYGAQLALLLAAHDDRIRAVVAEAPSSVVTATPATYPYGPSASAWSIGNQALAFRSGDGDEPGEAAIPVERIDGPLLLLSGDDDRIWPSGEMSRAIVRRLGRLDFPNDVRHLSFPDAGHNFGGGEQSYGVANLPPKERRGRSGGTDAGNSRAGIDAWEATLEFLQDTLR
ncbi:acyl-CoA thioesterase/bile acid-CoA:amino acid N-acyltransferase family protein [Maricaulis sp.]|uniref:acyl-CoA thioesterase/bile acid-CoA:amino acid N-acyltransferase family protein n=1 Tax=Maricaulis sp. TaxID=1486257 RepID=UPI00261D6D24|nr:acyl-CoA thioesterase/bile acid-CoA:amino acid N-acyltransferase family protein [Maricaulis sp.]